MSPEKTKILLDKYPKLFELTTEENGRMYPISLFMIECGDGWYNIISTLFACMQNEIDHNNAPQVALTQVKEKFGTLRVYYLGGNETIDGMEKLAERLSAVTCEECGAPGEIDHTAGWLRCRCKAHEKASWEA